VNKRASETYVERPEVTRDNKVLRLTKKAERLKRREHQLERKIAKADWRAAVISRELELVQQAIEAKRQE
jgi:prefoldin subunit 5